MEISKKLLLICLVLSPLFSFSQETDLNPEDPDWKISDTTIAEPEFVSQGQDAEIILIKNGQAFKLKPLTIEPVDMERYERLSDLQKASFHRVRQGMIKSLAVVLAKLRPTLGFFTLTKNKIVSIVKRRPGENQSSYELGQGKVEDILSSLNVKLWKESTKIADAKTISLVINPMLIVSASAPLKLGGAVGFSLAVGYNSETERMVVDVSTSLEKYKSGFVWLAGVKATTGLEFDASSGTSRVKRGEVFFPPVLPVWDGGGVDFYSFGVSTALSVPPPPITDVFTYRHSTTRFTVMRLSFSGVYAGRLVRKVNEYRKISLGTVKKFNSRVASMASPAVNMCKRLLGKKSNPE